MEAMAIGLPCIASDIEPIREIVSDGQNGVLIRPSDASAIADAVIGITNDRDRMNDLAEAASEHIAMAFTIGRAVRELEELYAKL